MGRPTLVVVTGPAGTGKTTLAHALAGAIGCPGICRDEIKEGMVHASADDFEPTPDDPLTRRTFGVFFDVVRLLLDAGVTLVAEAAFQDHVWRPQLEPLCDIAVLKAIRCRTDPSIARQRVGDRPGRSAHADRSVLDNADYYGDFQAISMPIGTIDVDTTLGYRPSLDEAVAFITAG